MDQLDAMKLFVRVAELESFTRCAEQLGIPKATLSAAPKRALWREHNAPCPRCSDQASKEELPLCVAHLCVKREIAPLFNACRCESHLKLDGIK